MQKLLVTIIVEIVSQREYNALPIQICAHISQIYIVIILFTLNNICSDDDICD